MISFQRIGSVSNAHVGSDFERAAQEVFASQGLRLVRGFSLPIGIGEKKQGHRFDLGSASAEVIVECKSHKWTTDGYVPSAKMTVWNEAMYYFAMAPEDYRKILFVLRDYSDKKGETLAEYYIRTHDHLVPDEVEIWEYDEDAGEATIWKKAVSENSLKKALEVASRLPEEEQDAVAEWLLAELAAEEDWERRFAGTQDALSVLAREASEEHQRGETKELKPESL
ncbi:MAG: hypothetical protein AVDCRST_MAG58-600 [uncultured Rubrobacteraceae bacterium]|uniref:Uncharacterized protein n=1 Tax=uncultured Rubrobacteraceae bacterium TaxID=349277 RepID=A0A6J4QLB3_9ACTN|nr:MAG: hypothetical protein AVDCRST_MAG58-600 [uncultured Rubrobacteraceae bacterium]